MTYSLTLGDSDHSCNPPRIYSARRAFRNFRDSSTFLAGLRRSTPLSSRDVYILLTAPPSPYKNRVELLQGKLDMLIVQTLQWGPQHGYGIVQPVRTQSGEVQQVETGSLYPALHRIERQGWVKSEWDITEANQRAKFYRLTPKGKKQLLQERDRWSQLVSAIGTILNPKRSRG